MGDEEIKFPVKLKSSKDIRTILSHPELIRGKKDEWLIGALVNLMNILEMGGYKNETFEIMKNRHIKCPSIYLGE